MGRGEGRPALAPPHQIARRSVAAVISWPQCGQGWFREPEPAWAASRPFWTSISLVEPQPEQLMTSGVAAGGLS